MKTSTYVLLFVLFATAFMKGFAQTSTVCQGNLLSNSSGYYGGFETGSASISPGSAGSDLHNGLPRNGSYQVVKSVNELGGGGYLDIRPRSGNYFLASHTPNKDERIWYAKVDVTPGVTYNFCTAVTLLKNLGNGANFLLGLYVNGNQIGEGRVTFDWTQICGTYTAPAGVTSIELSIEDPKKGLFFVAIDDICFSPKQSPPPPPAKVSLGNLVWNDVNGNGLKEADEAGVGDVTLRLYKDADKNNVADNNSAVLATTKTAADGSYKFSGLDAGDYIVGLVIANGYTVPPARFGNPNNDVDNDNNAINVVNNEAEVRSNYITLAGGTEPVNDGDDNNGNLTLDLAICGRGNLGDFVWNDLNGNGIQDTNEPGIQGVKVILTYPDGTTTSRTTDANGKYLFVNLGTGSHKVTFTTPSGYNPSPANQGSNDAKDSDPVNGVVTVSMEANKDNLTVDAGYVKQGSTGGIVALGNLVWNDWDGDGIKEEGEPGVGGVTVRLYKAANNSNQPTGGVIASTTTAADGTYKFSNLQEGRYIVGVIIPDGYTITGTSFPNPDDNRDNDNNGVHVINQAEYRSNPITLAAGTEPVNDGDDNNSNLTLDIGICGRSDIGDFVWHDLDRDGIQDANEPGIPGVKVTLTYPEGTTRSVTTDANGKYLFVNLGPGNHKVTFETPGGYTPSPANQGGDDAKDSDPVNGSVTVTVTAVKDDLTIDAGFMKGGTPPPSDCPITTDASGYYGGFESGPKFPANTGSDLHNGLPRNGSYEIGRSVTDFGGGGYLDVRPRSGSYFMGVHTSNDESDRIWYTKISVTPGQTYNFCAAVTLLKNLGNGARFILGVYANGTQIGEGRVTFDWTQICGTYTVPAGVTTLEFSIRDPKKGLFFVAIDDICISPVKKYTLGNYVWNDWDGSGTKDPDEYGIPGIQVKLYRDNDNNNLPDAGGPIATTNTDAKGFYKFINLMEGRYIASLIIPQGYTRSPNRLTATTTSPNPDNNVDNDNNLVRPENATAGDEIFTNAITLADAQEPEEGGYTNNTLDLAVCGMLWLGNFVWNDANGNGKQDAGEKGLNGVEVIVILPDGSTYKKQDGSPLITYTYIDLARPSVDGAGYYDIPRTGPGTYKLTFKAPADFQATVKDADGDLVDSDIDAEGNVTVVLTTQSNHDVDAGFKPVTPLAPPSAEMAGSEEASGSEDAACNLKVAFESQDPLCYNNRTGSIKATVTGNTGKLVYKWSNGSTGSNLMNVGAGKYTLKVTDQQTGCEVTSSEVALVNPAKIAATAKSAAIEGLNIACKDSKGNIELRVEGGKGTYSYEWSNGATTKDLIGVSAGKYTVTIKDGSKCPVTTSIVITEPEQKLQATPSVQQITCNNQTGEIELSATGGVAPYTYQWSNGSTGKILKALAAGKYSVIVKDAAGCSVSESIEIKNYDLVVKANAGRTLNIGTGETATLEAVATGGSGDYTYTWKAAAGLEETASAKATVKPTATAEYTVIAKDSYGCEATATVKVSVADQVVATVEKSVTEIFATERVRVTPNPAVGGTFSIMLNGFPAGKVEMKILDLNGKELTTRAITINPNQTLVPFSLAKLPPGMYIISVTQGDKNFKEKLVVK